MFEHIRSVLNDPTTVLDPYQTVMDGMNEIEDYLKDHSTDKAILQLYYDCAILVRRFVIAKNTSLRIVKIDPTDTSSSYHLGIAYMYLGDYKEATQIFQQALKLDPDSKLPLKYMYKTAKKLWSMKDETNVVFQQHRFEEAIKGYSNIIEECKTIKEDYAAIAYLNRSACYYNLCLYEDAMVDTNYCLELSPYYAKAYLRKARIMTKLEQNQASTPFLNYMYLTGDLSITNEVKNALKKDQLYTPAVQQVSSLAEFNRFLYTHKKSLVVLDVFASWCGPCKMLAPELEDMSCYFKNVCFVKVDGDVCRDLSSSFRIEAFPTILFFVDGKQVHKIQGADVQGIQQAIQQYGYCIHPDTLPPQ